MVQKERNIKRQGKCLNLKRKIYSIFQAKFVLIFVDKFAHFRVNISTIMQNNTFRTGFVSYYHVFTSYTKYFVSTRCELSYIKFYSFYNNKKPKTPFSHILMFVICNVFKPVPLNTCESGSQDTQEKTKAEQLQYFMEENLPEFGILSFTGLNLKLLFFGGQICNYLIFGVQTWFHLYCVCFILCQNMSSFQPGAWCISQCSCIFCLERNLE